MGDILDFFCKKCDNQTLEVSDHGTDEFGDCIELTCIQCGHKVVFRKVEKDEMR